jgi:hypothetical protein
MEIGIYEKQIPELLLLDLNDLREMIDLIFLVLRNTKINLELEVMT